MTGQLAQAWRPLIVCKGPDCTYDHLILLAQNVIHNLIILSTLAAVIIFIIVGFKLLASGGNTSAKDEAKKMLWKVLIGFVWILAAWLVVYTITSVLLRSEFNNVLGQPK